MSAAVSHPAFEVAASPIALRTVTPDEWFYVADLIGTDALPMAFAGRRLDLEPCSALAPVRVQELRYIPGFGGHRRRSACRCTIADELICGCTHPDKRESAAAIRQRQQGALVASTREARINEWFGDVYGTGADRELEPKNRKKRASEAKERIGPQRRERPLSDAEWRHAFIWMRRQPVRRALADQRTEIEAQAWIELRRPPVRSVFASFLNEVRRAWERAVRKIRSENETAWSLPRDERDAPDENSQ